MKQEEQRRKEPLSSQVKSPTGAARFCSAAGRVDCKITQCRVVGSREALQQTLLRRSDPPLTELRRKRELAKPPGVRRSSSGFWFCGSSRCRMVLVWAFKVSSQGGQGDSWIVTTEPVCCASMLAFTANKGMKLSVMFGTFFSTRHPRLRMTPGTVLDQSWRPQQRCVQSDHIYHPDRPRGQWGVAWLTQQEKIDPCR